MGRKERVGLHAVEETQRLETREAESTGPGPRPDAQRPWRKFSFGRKLHLNRTRAATNKTLHNSTIIQTPEYWLHHKEQASDDASKGLNPFAF
jgi:hypothetical protein